MLTFVNGQISRRTSKTLHVQSMTDIVTYIEDITSPVNVNLRQRTDIVTYMETLQVQSMTDIVTYMETLQVQSMLTFVNGQI